MTNDEIWNEAIHTYQMAMFNQMQKMTDRYLEDKENVPKPSWTSAIAVVSVVGDNLMKGEEEWK